MHNDIKGHQYESQNHFVRFIGSLREGFLLVLAKNVTDSALFAHHVRLGWQWEKCRKVFVSYQLAGTNKKKSGEK